MKTLVAISDLHLGSGVDKEKRNADFIEFLQKLENSDLVLLGDIFDFWIEYRSVIYKRYLRVLCALMEFMEKGNKIYFIPGNHDFYNTRYLSELGFDVRHEGLEIEWKGKKVFFHHGDTFSFSGKVTRFFYGNPLTKFVFKLLHPDLGIVIANMVSRTPLKVEGKTSGSIPEGTKKLFKDYDIIITGHTHSPGIRKISKGKYYVNAGEWIYKRNCVKITDNEITLYDGEKVIHKIN